MHWFEAVESNYSRKEPCEQGCSGFLIVWTSDTVNIALLFFQPGMTATAKLHAARAKQKKYTLHVRRKKYVKWTTFDTFLRRVNFILMFFQEELAFLLCAEKPFSGNLEG